MGRRRDIGMRMLEEEEEGRREEEVRGERNRKSICIIIISIIYT